MRLPLPLSVWAVTSKKIGWVRSLLTSTLIVVGSPATRLCPSAGARISTSSVVGAGIKKLRLDTIWSASSCEDAATHSWYWLRQRKRNVQNQVVSGGIPTMPRAPFISWKPRMVSELLARTYITIVKPSVAMPK